MTEPQTLQVFTRACEADIAAMRRALLVTAQSGERSELAFVARVLEHSRYSASAKGHTTIVNAIRECETSVDAVGRDVDQEGLNTVLDRLAGIEAALFDLQFAGDAPVVNVAALDETLRQLLTQPLASGEPLAVDPELVGIFRAEAAELLTRITDALAVLAARPGDQNTLWEIRRSAHTFKGAAGIIGLDASARIAHRMESLLDGLVELGRAASDEVVAFLASSTRQLEMITMASDLESGVEVSDLTAEYEALLSRLAQLDATNRASGGHNDDPAASASASNRIIRVSLDRVDELICLSHTVALNRARIAERLPKLDGLEPELASLFDAQAKLISELRSRLLHVRMVRFSTLATRLRRAVHITATETGKQVALDIRNGQLEIDTQAIDALVEPLLHLLKNAVVHGIEPPETRRLIGKPETGTITLGIDADEEAIVVSISDDGAGISTEVLKAKAVENGSMDQKQAELLTEREALKLVFSRGLTTARSVDLNAGRGVGMSIAQEVITERGGTILVESARQTGTTFTILMPVATSRIDPKPQVLMVEEDTKPDSPLILVVDDSASVRHQIQSTGEEAGYRVITAENGAEALELLLDGSIEPDLILSDVEMPQIDGWQLAEYVKTDKNLGHIPIVILTSLDRQAHHSMAMRIGASELLSKPLSAEHLDRVIREHVVARAA